MCLLCVMRRVFIAPGNALDTLVEAVKGPQPAPDEELIEALRQAGYEMAETIVGHLGVKAVLRTVAAHQQNPEKSGPEVVYMDEGIMAWLYENAEAQGLIFLEDSVLLRIPTEQPPSVH